MRLLASECCDASTWLIVLRKRCACVCDKPGIDAVDGPEPAAFPRCALDLRPTPVLGKKLPLFLTKLRLKQPTVIEAKSACQSEALVV